MTNNYLTCCVGPLNGLKKGGELILQGKSNFKFSGDKTSEVTDIS